MRKEIIGILLFFLVVFTLISLVSYHPGDPSINNAGAAGEIQNQFGFIGSQLAGILVGLFGLGAFWIPVLLLLCGIQFFGDGTRKGIIITLVGGILLIVTTGSLLAMHADHYILWESKFSSGGIVGIPFKSLLVTYANVAGGLIFLVLVWLVGFILTTRFSLVTFGRVSLQATRSLFEKLRTVLVKKRERKVKAKKRKRAQKELASRDRREIEIRAPQPKPEKPVARPKQAEFAFMEAGTGFKKPLVSFLDDPEPVDSTADNENLQMLSRLLEKKLEDFGVRGSVVTVSPGPVITTFEYEPAPGVKINKIVNLSDDLALALRAVSIRIVAPIPGKAVIGIEIPNENREMVRFKSLVASPAFERSASRTTLCLGKDIVGNPVVAELDKMPHLLIAGATGTGKSVGLNTMICSMLYKADPEEVKFIMIDPKRIELSGYDGIPHLISPVVTDVKKANNALFWAVREMERRYELLAENKMRNIGQYNKKAAKLAKQSQKEGTDNLEKLPYIVIIIDELADLMMASSRDVELALTRLAQMARAAGIHLILATQRPSVDVLTGIIKANFPTRLTFQVSSRTDSRTIIDANGAETLLGNGDMLFLPPGTAKLQRIHGAYISEAEIGRIIACLKEQKKPDYVENITEAPPAETLAGGEKEYDEMYDDAVALVTKNGKASISMIQRHLRIGYNRAARIIEVMEQEGVVGPSDGAKQRKVLVKSYDEIS